MEKGARKWEDESRTNRALIILLAVRGGEKEVFGLSKGGGSGIDSELDPYEFRLLISANCNL